jgi:hypothetical protein
MHCFTVNRNNLSMNRKPQDFKFKDTQVFDWELEPQQERKTDFGHSTGFGHSTSFSTFSPSGYHPHEGRHTSIRHREQPGGGFAKLVVACALLLGVCTVAIMEIPHYLR